MNSTVSHCLSLMAQPPWDLAVAATLGEQALTFAQLRAQATQLARALAARGVGYGSRVVVQMGWSLDQLPLFLAVQDIGAVFAPINPDLSVQETAVILDYLDPALIVCGDEDQVIRPARSVLLMSGKSGPQVQGGGRASRPAEPQPPSPDDGHAIFLTSDSAGLPKGVLLSHRAAWLRIHMGTSRFATPGGQGELMSVPMFHWAGWNCLLENWVHRRPVHFPASLSGDDLAKTTARHRPALIHCIPALWDRLLNSSVDLNPNCVRSVGAGTSRFDPILTAQLKTRFPQAQRSVLYGSTEFGAAMGLGEGLIDANPGAIGLPHPGVEARLDGGELMLRGPTMMAGYFDLPDQTARVLQGGWYRTGDLARQDQTGVFSITRRARDVIRSGGETIAPVEVELAMADCPGVAQVAVVGLPDPHWGEVVCAAIACKPRANVPDIATIRRHLGPRLASFKHPRRLVVMDDLPTATATDLAQRSHIRCKVMAMCADGCIARNG